MLTITIGITRQPQRTLLSKKVYIKIKSAKAACRTMRKGEKTVQEGSRARRVYAKKLQRFGETA